MRNRWSFEGVKKYFEDHNCDLLESTYKNAHVPMNYRCSCGNQSTINFNNFKTGKRCRGCAGKRAASKTRHSHDYIKDYFSSRGCELLGEYINSNMPVDYRCSCGNISKISFADFSSGKRCRICKYNKTANKLKFDYDYVRNYFEEHGCELLDKEYKNARTPLRYKCSCGNESKIVFYSFKVGNRCKDCGIRKNTGENSSCWRPDREQLKLELKFRRKCYELLQRSLETTNQKKNSRTASILGYSWQELKEHVENHSNYNKVKDGEWHLDHIFPIKAFIDHNVWDIKIINALDNLQPLEAKENLSKNDSYIKEDFINYLKRKRGTI